jgi:hypothetical protein
MVPGRTHSAASKWDAAELAVVKSGDMDFEGIARGWNTDGFAILPGYLSAEDLAPARGELEAMFPTPAGFHDGTDPRRSRFLCDEFNGIDTFPFTSVQMSLLAVHERLVRLAERLLEETDLRLYSAEAWAKYTGAADYDQSLHRDYLNHTLVVPTEDVRYQQVELFVFLVFGFPAPGHAYWTPETLKGVAQRYPGLDVTPWA